MFDIDLMSRTPIYEQLYRRVIELIMKGVLQEQDKLPSVRSLATDLGVNPNTVAKAYTLLERDGIIYSVQGKGCFVAKHEGKANEKLTENFRSAVREALDAGADPEELITVVKELSLRYQQNKRSE